MVGNGTFPLTKGVRRTLLQKGAPRQRDGGAGLASLRHSPLQIR